MCCRCRRVLVAPQGGAWFKCPACYCLMSQKGARHDSAEHFSLACPAFHLLFQKGAAFAKGGLPIPRAIRWPSIGSNRPAFRDDGEAVARQRRWDALLFTAMVWMFIPAYACFAFP